MSLGCWVWWERDTCCGGPEKDMKLVVWELWWEELSRKVVDVTSQWRMLVPWGFQRC